MVLVISLIIAVICSSLIMLSFFNKIQIYNNNLYQKLKNNIDSGIDILTVTTDTNFARAGLYVDLYGQGTDSVYLKRNSWGVFEYVFAKASAKGFELKTSYLVGNDSNKNGNDYALYVSDLGRPISVCGNTKIVGNVYLPTQGIRREYSPVPYSGKELFVGKEFKSDFKLPAIQSKHIQQIITWSKSNSQNHEIVTSKDSLYNSFENELLVMNIGHSTQIPYTFIKGNVLIVADSVINIRTNQYIEDAIIVARGINIAQDFKGMGQFYAFDSLVVGSNAKLSYPSVLGLIKLDYKTQKPFLKINENVQIGGLVFAHHQVVDMMGTYTKISKNAKIRGEVYSEGFLEINGSVYGSVSAFKLILNTSSSIYENYLLDAEIDFGKRHKQYVSSNLLKTNVRKKIAKCLY